MVKVFENIIIKMFMVENPFNEEVKINPGGFDKGHNSTILEEKTLCTGNHKNILLNILFYNWKK